MQVFVYKNEAEVGKAAGMIVASEILKKPDCILGLATGSTPIPTYQEMIRMNKEGILDFSKVRSFNLDEYIGLSPEHVCSYRRFMNEQLFDHINIDKANTHVPCGIGADHEADAKAYDAAVEAAGGIDLQILGIGHDGHIGFNEPGDEFVSGTNIVTLTDMTIDANTRFFEKREDVPRQAITLGNRNIMAAKRIILLATGKGKARAIAQAIKGNITPKMPASLLQVHPNVQFLLDEDAASEL
ncbi:MAG: glucosamine-6-phosphate deaminase [Clostridiales bacterium]|nr:glucosamine-6-phosphate deaminase [Clostridiales bacterium]MDD6871388.1 glucosamine-6-phosphate deaminase [Clostridiales bacterium]MDD7365681.1 glucosamine-6-phosphate deaminase [Clostridiales bacterium]